MNRREFMASAMAGGLSAVLPAMPSVFAEEKKSPVWWEGPQGNEGLQGPPLAGYTHFFEIDDDFELLDVYWRVPDRTPIRDLDRFLDGHCMLSINGKGSDVGILHFPRTKDLPSFRMWRSLPKPVLGIRRRISAGSFPNVLCFMEPPIIPGTEFYLQGKLVHGELAWYYALPLRPIERSWID